jgi:hypothetical protein
MNPSKESSNPSQLTWWRSPGVIYFIAAGSPPSAIKIGVTTRATLLERMKKTQTHNHEPIELLGVIRFNDGEYPTRDAEDQQRLLHLKFAHLLRFKPGTRGAEWFSVSPELLRVIEETAITPEVLGVQRFVCTPVSEDVVA